MDFNKAIIIGRLAQDPELKALPSGVKVTNFSLATNRVWKDNAGTRQEHTDFHNVVVFGRQAETTAQYLKKGNIALVEGRMQTRSWEGQDGQKRYRTEVVAENVRFGPKGSGGGTPAAEGAAKDAGASGTSQPEQLDTIEYPSDEINPDDIPF